jgi:hypothetical protein
MMRLRWFVCLLALIGGLAAPAAAQQDGVNQIKTDRGSVLRYYVALPPGPVRGIAILFVGSNGRLGLDRGPEPASKNFLVRARGLFAARGFVVALPDAPSDRGSEGLDGWRTSQGHMADIGKLARHLRDRWPVPVWLIGNSRGTISAAAAGVRVPIIAGVILTSTVTVRSKRRPATVFDASVRELNLPVLVVHHQNDACRVTPPSGAGRLFARLSAATVREIRMIEGGRPAEGEACGPLSPHGFLGVERETVRAIVNWIGTFDR